MKVSVDMTKPVSLEMITVCGSLILVFEQDEWKVLNPISPKPGPFVDWLTFIIINEPKKVAG